MKNMVRRRSASAAFSACVCGALTLAFSGVISPRAIAQNTGASAPAPTGQSAATAAPAARVARRPPNVQVIAMPLPTGDWMVAAVYSRAISRDEALRRQKAFEQASGWKTRDVVVETKSLGRALRSDVKSSPLDAGIPKDNALTSVRFQTSANVINFTDGTVDISPWILAYRDESRLNLTYLWPPELRFPFRGVRRYADSGLTVEMTGLQKGALNYSVGIVDHTRTAFNLPRYQEANAARTIDDRTRLALEARLRQTRYVGIGLITLFALGAGVLVYIWATRFTGSGAAGGGRANH